MSLSQRISIVSLSVLASIIGSLFFITNMAFAAPSFDGTGTPEDPYQITNCEQLQEIQDNLGAHYRLQNNIDCSVTNPDHEDFDPLGTWGDETGFQPIGTNEDLFTGTLNGNNHTISGVYIYLPDPMEKSTRGGIFGITLGATIQNIYLTDFDIEAANPVGALVAGAINSTISNIHASDSVMVTGRRYIGGIIGYLLDGSVLQNSSSAAHVSGQDIVGGLVGTSEEATVTHSSSTATVSGTMADGDNFGGLIGELMDSQVSYSSFEGDLDVSNIESANVGGIAGIVMNSIIEYVSVSGNISGAAEVGGLFGLLVSSTVGNAYMQGTVTATEGMVGGFAGLAGIDLTLSNSYAHADVIGGEVVGGFIGLVFDFFEMEDEEDDNLEGPVNIINSYALGTVSSTQEEPEYIGGFIGFADGDDITIISSYWNTEISEQSESAGGTGKTTAEMQNITTYDGWNIQASTNQDLQYPTLSWQLDLETPTWLIYQTPSPTPTQPKPSSGGSVQQRVSNLVDMGKQQEAEQLKEQFSHLFETQQTQQIQQLLIQIQQLQAILNQLTNNTPSPQTLVCTPSLRIGSTGAMVRELQRLLGNIGTDGQYGPQTANAVGIFQGKNNLTQDQIAGPKTCSVLLSQTQNQ